MSKVQKAAHFSLTVKIPRNILKAIEAKAADERISFTAPLEKVAEALLFDALSGENEMLSEIFTPDRTAYAAFLDESWFEFTEE